MSLEVSTPPGSWVLDAEKGRFNLEPAVGSSNPHDTIGSK